MGMAMLMGWLEKGLDPSTVIVIDPAPSDDVKAFLAKDNISHLTSLEEARRSAAVIVLAVKPQIMNSVLSALNPIMKADSLILSLAAGITISGIRSGINKDCRIVRVMPNVPAMVGRGMSVVCVDAEIDATQKDMVTMLLAAVGDVAWIDNEELMDAVTGVSGSGPAYVFYMVEAMAKAGEAAGLSSDLAMQLARATVIGAGECLHQNALSAASLREAVTSKGGTTAAALEVLMSSDGLMTLMENAVAAATHRSRELA